MDGIRDELNVVDIDLVIVIQNNVYRPTKDFCVEFPRAGRDFVSVVTRDTDDSRG
jgi:hypothetical protein